MLVALIFTLTFFGRSIESPHHFLAGTLAWLIIIGTCNLSHPLSNLERRRYAILLFESLEVGVNQNVFFIQLSSISRFAATTEHRNKCLHQRIRSLPFLLNIRGLSYLSLVVLRAVTLLNWHIWGIASRLKLATGFWLSPTALSIWAVRLALILCMSGIKFLLRNFDSVCELQTLHFYNTSSILNLISYKSLQLLMEFLI